MLKTLFCFRAKRRLIMNKQLFHLLHGPAMDTFQKIRIPSSIPAHKTFCVFCADDCKLKDDEFLVAVWQEAITVFPDKRFPGGPVCRSCQSVPFRKIPLTNSGIQRVTAFGVPWTINSWTIVMSGILKIANPFKNFGAFITPVSRNMVIFKLHHFEYCFCAPIPGLGNCYKKFPIKPLNIPLRTTSFSNFSDFEICNVQMSTDLSTKLDHF